MRANSPELDRNWLRAVSGDKRLLAVHRLALIGLGLRNGSPDCIACETGLDLSTVLRATDAGRRRGWLADFPRHSGRDFVFTFPFETSHRNAGGPVMSSNRQKERNEQRDTRDEWISWVIADTGMTPLARLIGVRLALSINIKELDFPAVYQAEIGADYSVVAARVGTTPEMAGFAIAELQERGWLSVIRRDGCFHHCQLSAAGRRHLALEVVS